MHDSSFSYSGENSSRRISVSTNPFDLLQHVAALMANPIYIKTPLSSYNYPPHNILSIGEDTVEIQVSVAGFSKQEITITEHESVLSISGKKNTGNEPVQTYVYKGLATRSFDLRWKLPRNVVISQDAKIEDGILTVRLERIVPDSEKPRVIEIK